MKHWVKMAGQSNKTFFLTKEAAKTKKWFVFDAKGKNLGRFASEVTKVLRGKHEVVFTPHIDHGSGVIVINADQILVTGEKEAQKIYQYYTGHVGGRREIPYRMMKDRKPAYIIYHAVRGMMPKTKLGRAQLKRLRIFFGEKHSLSAQVPLVANV